jgi:6-pyruvoyltetrahydropterin/6-carboxytetrahydropterin synthase
MPYRICKTIEIENGHMLSKHPDKCKFPHGHTRKVEFILESDDLDQNEMVCDFKIIKQVMADFLETWDHSLAVNTRDPMFKTLRQAYGERIIPFEGKDPTTEIMVKALFDVCQSRLEQYAQRDHNKFPLSKAARLKSVRLWETSSSWAEYSAG